MRFMKSAHCPQKLYMFCNEKAFLRRGCGLTFTEKKLGQGGALMLVRAAHAKKGAQLHISNRKHPICESHQFCGRPLAPNPATWWWEHSTMAIMQAKNKVYKNEWCPIPYPVIWKKLVELQWDYWHICIIAHGNSWNGSENTVPMYRGGQIRRL